MTSSTGLFRLAAFSTDPAGGNPAGVWIGETMPDERTMQRIARSVGFSETAFVAPAAGRERSVRYFSPEAEVPFCGHATIATGAMLARIEGNGVFELETPVGVVRVDAESGPTGARASLTSVDPEHGPPAPALVAQVLDALHWSESELDAEIPAARAFAGAWHLVLAADTPARLADLDYDFERLREVMLTNTLTTIQLIWRESDTIFHARNPFPVGGIVEDPATGAAAAALGGYLRDAGLVTTPTQLTIEQGSDMGRPSQLVVDIAETGGIVVTGQVVDLP